MKYSKEGLLNWQKNLNRKQFEQVIMMVLDADQQGDLSKPIELIDPATFLNDTEKMSKLEDVAQYLESHYIRQRPPDIALRISKPKHQSTEPNPLKLPFTDREKQIVKILYHASAPYLILDAPIGYGKTELLKQLKIEFGTTDWNTFYVELNGTETPHEVCEKMLLSIPSPVKLGVNVPVELITGSEICKIAQKKPGAGVVLLVDFVGRPTSELLLFLANTFIKTVSQAVVGGVRHYQEILHPFRVILAGRYSMAWQPLIPFELPFTWLPLPAFDFEIIRDATYTFLPEASISSIDQVAAHVFYLTGGHPALIANILVDYKNFPVAPDAYLAAKDDNIWSNWIAPCVETIHQELLTSFPKLSQVLDAITIFRVLDDPCLQEIVDCYDSKTFYDCYNLQEVLTQTNVFRLGSRLVKNYLVRRLLGIRMWRTNPTHFLNLTTKAQKFCLENIARTPSPQEVWAVEYLFQFLHQFAPQVQDNTQRSMLRDEFFQTAVPLMLNTYLGRPGLTPQQRRGEINALKEQLKRDWEFQYTVNYYLRQDQYNNSQFHKLVEQL